MSSRAAVLHVVAHVEIAEQAVRIDHVGAPFGFALHAASGVCIATSEHPLPLVKYAFANGALRVVHNYDLGVVDRLG